MASRDEVHRNAARLVERAEAEQSAIAARAEELRARARAAAEAIAERYAVRRVWLYGSLAWGEPHASSDVDLLVDGAPAAAWLSLIAVAEDLIRGSVDVLRSEDAPPELVERVHREGVLLYESA